MSIKTLACFALLICCFGLNASGQVRLDSNLVAYYPFNNSFKDASGHGNHGTAKNGTTFHSDQWGNANCAAYFDGVNDWIDVGEPDFLFRKNYTIAFRYATNNTRCQTILTRADYTGSPEHLQFQVGFNHPAQIRKGMFLGTNHTGTCYFGSSHDLSHFGVAQKPVSGEAWNFVVITFDSGVKNIYINGHLEASDTVEFDLRSNPYPTVADSCPTGTFRMGNWWQGDPLYFAGLLDEVRLYNRTLNRAEIDSLGKLVTKPLMSLSVSNSRTDRFQIYPNPANDQLIVQGNQLSGTASIRTITGQIVSSQELLGGKILFNTSELPSGLYFLGIGCGEEMITYKVVIQH